jgi:hypothetical protein
MAMVNLEPLATHPRSGRVRAGARGATGAQWVVTCMATGTPFVTMS